MTPCPGDHPGWQLVLSILGGRTGRYWLTLWLVLLLVTTLAVLVLVLAVGADLSSLVEFVFAVGGAVGRRGGLAKLSAKDWTEAAPGPLQGSGLSTFVGLTVAWPRLSLHPF